MEKSGIVEQLSSWFGEYGIGIVALGGYASQSYVDEIAKEVEKQGRPAVFIYAGDFDPSGEDIERDFLERSDCWEEQHRIALTMSQIQVYNLPPLPGKAWDARAAGFIERHGQLMQVELDALDPNDLHALYRAAFNQYWDEGTYEGSLAKEEREEAQLKSGDIVLNGEDARLILDLTSLGLMEGEAPRATQRAHDRLVTQLDEFNQSQEDPNEEEDNNE